MTFRAAIASGLLALIAACGPPPQTQPHPASPSASSEPPVATPASQFAAHAAMFEAYQIQAAQIAQQSAQSAAAKAYATAVLAEHQATLQQLNAAAQAAGMPAPSGALDENSAAYLDMLRRTNPQTFDVTYASQQALMSMSASGLYDSFTSTAPDSPLKQWAQGQSQHVHDAITAARQLARDVTAGH